LHGVCRVPGDKSISHRALLLAAIAEGPSELQRLGSGTDVAATMRCLRLLGVRIDGDLDACVVHGEGLHGWRTPPDPLDCENSGTTMRLLVGLLAGQGIKADLRGDASLSRRPMGRVVAPLRAMGASISASEQGSEAFAPLGTRGGRLRGVEHRIEPPSAQVKSCLLLAGLYADGATRLREARPTRDHTERMLARMGAGVHRDRDSLALEAPSSLRPLEAFQCPGDPSSAAFLLGAAAAREGSAIQVEGVGLNPTRIGFIHALERMGATVTIEPGGDPSGEPMGNLSIEGHQLVALQILPEEAPELIDELPLLAVLATQASGRTQIGGAQELRVKESDRISAMARGLNALGARVTERPDGWIIEGDSELRGARVDAAGDHRVAMALAVAAGYADGTTDLQGAEWAAVSFPEFFEVLDRLKRDVDG
jgi:3-phosphoshikimate 1-carboxyvinyltransferase